MLKSWIALSVMVAFGTALYWLLFSPRRKKPESSETGDSGQPQIEMAKHEKLEGPALSARLHDLSSRIEPFAQDAAHPSEIADHADFQIARDIFADPATPFETVMNYALGASFALSYPALAGLAKRPDRQDGLARVLAHFENFPPWGKHFALLYFESLQPRPPVGAPLLQAEEYWAGSSWITGTIRDSFERRAQLGDVPGFGENFSPPKPERAAAIRSVLSAIQHPFSQILLAELEEAQRSYVDSAFLSSFGRLWDRSTRASLAITPEEWRPALEQAPQLLTRKPVRSLIAVGEPQTGKTTFLQLLGHRLAGEGWQVFEAGGAELMAGQQWFGQLEERIRRVISEVTVEKKLVWYVPDLLQLARSGTHQGQSASILEQIIPSVASGAIVIWSEATPATLTRLLQMQPGMRNLLEAVRLEPMEADQVAPIAREVATRLAKELEVDVDPRCADTAIESAQHYLSHGNLPGSALALLKLTIRNAGKESSRTVVPADVIAALSQLTGLPVSILDAREKLDLSAMNSFFTARVMGQDEAVEAVIERIAMLKAGLSDPTKPVGVFLFAGPTGTGKTELAKTTAEFLFGSPDRMIRLDMSEFQTPDSLAKIIGDGTPGETGSLIARVRKQPFSVVLLDEFEKSWSGIWDLFLQVFDDGRLSDPSGQVADFRHCLIILTSNLGATAHRSGGFGFAPPGDRFSSSQVLHAIAQTYRPEFQNRIDRIIVFNPLNRELMRGILRKELDDVLARRGLKDREWAVEWESSALEFLLEKGFTPEMGARPLKRAIDRHLLAPLAATIVERKFPEGEQFLFVRSNGRSLQAEFVDPDGGAIAQPATATPAAPALSLASIILTPRGNEEEFAALTRQLDEAEATLASSLVEDLKTGIAERMNSDGFWDSPERHAILARYALLDRLKAATSTARHLQARLAAGGKKTKAYPREVVTRLALQVHLVQQGLEDIVDEAPVEVALAVEPALDGAAADRKAAQQWCEDILAMYRAWSKKRNMQLAEISTVGDRQLPVLLVSGFGAHRVLAGEIGLHVLEGEQGASRFTARVSLVAAPLGDMPEAQRRNAIAKALDAQAKSNNVRRRYRREPDPLVRNASGSWRSPQVDIVMGGAFDLLDSDRN